MLPVAKEIMHGYVFLADRDSQEGIASAGDRINAIKNELDSLETSVDVIALSQNDAGFTLAGETYSGSTESAKKERAYADTPFLANRGFSGDSAKSADSDSSDYGKGPGTRVGANDAEFACPLNPDVPRSFTKAEVDVLSNDILQDILNRFRWDDGVLLLAKTGSRMILMENYEVFSHVRETPEEIKAKIIRTELDRRAQLCLQAADEGGGLDKPAIHTGLMHRLAEEASDKGISGLESKEELEDGLAHILALRPDILPKAVSEAFAAYTVSSSSSDLPSVLESNASSLNDSTTTCREQSSGGTATRA